MKTKKTKKLKKRSVAKSRHIRFLYWLLDIKHPAHTGKLLPAKETSFGLLLFLCLLFLPFALPQQKAVKGVKTDSGNINVSGNVGGVTPPPTFQPVITSPKPGVTNTQQTSVDGICSPNLLVKVFRNNLFAGEAYCSAQGRFSILITLFTGRNDIKAINYDQFDQPGPESEVIIVTYKAISIGVNKQKQSDILIEADYYLRQVGVGEEVYWTITVTGGSPPYEINFDWGDGKYSQEKLDVVGQRIIGHTYKSSGKYTIFVKVSDSTKASSVLQLAVLVVGKIITPGGAGTISECEQKATNIIQTIRCRISPVVSSVILPIYWVVVSILLLAWLVNKVRNSRHIHGGRPHYGHS